MSCRLNRIWFHVPACKAGYPGSNPGAGYPLFSDTFIKISVYCCFVTMVTNKEVQDRFNDFLEGDAVEWQLLKMFFHQNGGFSRKAMNDDGEIDAAIGLSRTDDEIVVSMMSIEGEDVHYATLEDSFRISVDEHIKHRLHSMVELALSHGSMSEEIEFDPSENDELKEEMYT